MAQGLNTRYLLAHVAGYVAKSRDDTSRQMQKKVISVNLNKKELTKRFFLVSLWIKRQIVIQGTAEELSGCTSEANHRIVQFGQMSITGAAAIWPHSITTSPIGKE